MRRISITIWEFQLHFWGFSQQRKSIALKNSWPPCMQAKKSYSKKITLTFSCRNLPINPLSNTLKPYSAKHHYIFFQVRLVQHCIYYRYSEIGQISYFYSFVVKGTFHMHDFLKILEVVLGISVVFKSISHCEWGSLTPLDIGTKKNATEDFRSCDNSFVVWEISWVKESVLLICEEVCNSKIFYHLLQSQKYLSKNERV